MAILHLLIQKCLGLIFFWTNGIYNILESRADVSTALTTYVSLYVFVLLGPVMMELFFYFYFLHL